MTLTNPKKIVQFRTTLVQHTPKKMPYDKPHNEKINADCDLHSLVE